MAKSNRKIASTPKGSKVGDKKEKSPKKKGKEDGSKAGESADFWDRVSDDVASGYTDKNDDDKILNEDQLPHDHERGDKPDEE